MRSKLIVVCLGLALVSVHAAMAARTPLERINDTLENRVVAITLGSGQVIAGAEDVVIGPQVTSYQLEKDEMLTVPTAEITRVEAGRPSFWRPLAGGALVGGGVALGIEATLPNCETIFCGTTIAKTSASVTAVAVGAVVGAIVGAVRHSHGAVHYDGPFDRFAAASPAAPAGELRATDDPAARAFADHLADLVRPASRHRPAAAQ